MTDVFISYAREDRKFVQRLHDALASAGRESWVDWEGIPASAKWMAEVRAAIDEADCFCFVVSPDSVESPVCREEAAHAAASNKRILPLLHRPVADGLVPETVAAHNWIEFNEQADFDQAFATLVKALETEPEHLRTHTRLLVRAKEWEANARNRSYLLRGQDLTQAESWLGTAQGKEPAPTQLHTAYVLASRRAASRRQRSTIGAVALALVVSLVLSVVAVIQRSEAQDAQAVAEEQAALATSRLLAVRARELIDSRLDLAALLSLEAYGLSPTVEARSAELAVLQRTMGVRRLLQPEGVVEPSIAFDPSGTRIAVASLGGQLSMYDAVSWTPVWTVDVGAPVTSVAIDDAGERVATGDQDGQVRLWDAATGEPVGDPIEVAGISLVWVVDFGTGGRLAIGGTDGTFTSGRVALMATADAAPAFTVEAPGPVFDVAISPTGDRLAAGSWGGEEHDRGYATVWDLTTGAQIAQRTIPGRSHTEAVAFDPGGSLLAVAGGRALVDHAEGAIVLWDLEGSGDDSDRVIQVPTTTGNDASFTSVAFTEDGATLIAASWDGTVRLFDAGSASALGPPLRVHAEDKVTQVALAPSGASFVSADEDGTIAEWSLGQVERRFPLTDTRTTGIVWDVAFDASGERVALSTDSGDVPIFDVSSHDQLVTIDPVAGGSEAIGARGVAFLGDGSIVTGLTLEGPGFVQALATWDPTSGEPTGEPIPIEWENVFNVKGPADRQLVALLTMDDVAHLLDLEGGEPAVVEHLRAMGVAKVATVGEDGLRILDIDTLETVAGPVEADVGLAAFGRGDDVLVTVGSDGSLTVRSGDDLSVLSGPFETGVGDIYNVAVSPDGRTIAATSGEGTIALLDAETGVLLGEPLFVPSNETIDTIAFSSAGVLASGGSPGLFLWDPVLWTRDADQLTETLCGVVGRNLTPAEWDQYLPDYPYHATCG